MFFHIQNLINPIAADEPDPAAANILQEGLGGQFGEMRTMMQYLFQSFNARGDAKPFKDLIQGVGIEEISHVELITTTINMLLDGSARYQGRASTAKLKTVSGKRANVWFQEAVGRRRWTSHRARKTRTITSSHRSAQCQSMPQATRGVARMCMRAATSC